MSEHDRDGVGLHPHRMEHVPQQPSSSATGAGVRGAAGVGCTGSMGGELGTVVAGAADSMVEGGAARGRASCQLRKGRETCTLSQTLLQEPVLTRDGEGPGASLNPAVSRGACAPHRFGGYE